MTTMSPSDMAARLGSGLLSFPVTHFDADGVFLEGPYRLHCAWMLEHELAGLFAAGGTGEFFSLTPGEVAQVVAAAVAEAGGALPVISGCCCCRLISSDRSRTGSPRISTRCARRPASA